MTLGNFFIFAASFFTAYGVWQIIYWKIITKSYKKYLDSEGADKGMTLLDHTSQKFGSDTALTVLSWKPFRQFKKDYYYRLLTIIKAIFGFLLGAGLTIAYLVMKASEYSLYLTIKL